MQTNAKAAAVFVAVPTDANMCSHKNTFRVAPKSFCDSFTVYLLSDLKEKLWEFSSACFSDLTAKPVSPRAVCALLLNDCGQPAGHGASAGPADISVRTRALRAVLLPQTPLGPLPPRLAPRGFPLSRAVWEALCEMPLGHKVLCAAERRGLAVSFLRAVA